MPSAVVMVEPSGPSLMVAAGVTTELEPAAPPAPPEPAEPVLSLWPGVPTDESLVLVAAVVDEAEAFPPAFGPPVEPPVRLPEDTVCDW